MKKGKNLIKVFAKYLVMVLVFATMVNNEQVVAGSHYVSIYSPYANQRITELYKTDYEYEILGSIPFPRDTIIFNFKIQNDDGYYIKYDAFIDSIPDNLLNNLDWGTHHIKYNAGDFLQKYGRGTHTFTINCYHAIPYVRPPFGLVKSDYPYNGEDIYWVDNQGYLLELADEVSVSFIVNPPLCHFVGFGYIDEERWQGDILPLRDMLQDDSAHYFTGYFSAQFYWTPDSVESTITELDNYEESHDIVVEFSTHGMSSVILYVNTN